MSDCKKITVTDSLLIALTELTALQHNLGIYSLTTVTSTILGNGDTVIVNGNGVLVNGSQHTPSSGLVSHISINGNGVIFEINTATTYTLPTASRSVLGGVKVDGTSITINNGVISAVGSINTNTSSILISTINYTATAGQTLFSTPSYAIGQNQLAVYIDGVRQYSTEYVETSTTSVTLNQGCSAGDVILVEVSNCQQNSNLIPISKINYTATAGQTVFSTPSYAIGQNQLKIYINGVRQYSTEYNETNSTTVSLHQGCSVGDVVLVEVNSLVGSNLVPVSTINYTATAGQTLFSTPSYAIGQNQLAVYIDGVRQYSTEYVETSTTSVTLNQGCSAGDVILVEVTLSSGVGSGSGGSGGGLGINQSWQVFQWSDRQANVTYHNTTGAPIEIMLTYRNVYPLRSVALYVNGVVMSPPLPSPSSVTFWQGSAIVPNNSSYQWTTESDNVDYSPGLYWIELR